ncbi:CatB-related O-acetyltransferase [Paraclostridium dentum]|uniref:CatB-related O-acetyltransferase n=1 Tax=Paraclostridium dentum TaxID=2662455 RepID=UPI003B006AE8
MKKILLNILIKLYKIKNRKIKKLIIKCILKLEGGYFWSSSVRKLYSEYHGIDIGIGTYGGCFDIDKIPGGTSFGKYCSIAPTIYVFNANHPKDFVSTHPIFYNPDLKFVKEEKIQRNKLRVGNDVWIGQNVIITSNVSIIGDGAIIGAGSVVTKNVGNYEIIAGVPGRAIGKRFKDETIEKLKNSKWWDLDINCIKEKVNVFTDVDNIYKLK